MLRRLVVLATLSWALTAHATTRYVADRAAAPVKWREWGRSAIESARKSNRPLFLSVGFASSWDCQRMHREAFLNGENAELLNTYFVPVLVDRIEYPEVAETYEAILRSMKGTEGWPANLIVTPSLEPFAGGGAMSTADLGRLLVTASNRWANERAAVTAEARDIVAKARGAADPRAPGDVDATTLDAVVEELAHEFERTKSLSAMQTGFLLRYASRTRHEQLLPLIVETLQKLAASSRRDQLGGGFHRCADCYEKMLPDQALLGLAYLEAWQITGDPDLQFVARTTFDYVLRDLRKPRGLFDSSQDAYNLVPAQGPVFEEGAFYLWQKDEIAHLLGADAAGKVFRVYAMKDGVANRPSLEHAGLLKETRDALAPSLQKMLDVRQKRPEPFRELPVAGWNGLMISALARAGAVLAEPRYTEAAADAAQVALTRLWNAQKKTLSRSESGTPALAEDYAMLVGGLIELFEGTYDPKWLELAKTLQQRQDELFWDASVGRYRTGASAPLEGLMSESDDATPAASSVAATNLLRLAALTGRTVWRDRAGMIFQSQGARMRTSGARLAQLASAVESSLRSPSIVVVTGDPRKKETYDALKEIQARWEPMRAVVLLPLKGPGRDRLVKSLPFTAALTGDPKQTITYTCSNGECRRQ